MGDEEKLRAALESIGETLSRKGRPGPEWLSALEWGEKMDCSSTTAGLKIKKLVDAGLMEKSEHQHVLPGNRSGAYLYRLK